MKRNFLSAAVLLTVVFLAFVSGCEPIADETCEQDEICTGKSVTVCCSDSGCYYQYNGIQYADDPQSLAKLAADLGCTYALNPNYEQEIKDIILKLEALGEYTRSK